MSNARADILLVTVTKVETMAVLNAFGVAGREASPHSIDSRVYFDLGIVNGARVKMTQSEMGAGGLGASLQAVGKGIAALSPTAVIMVGIAFGMNETKQSIGDILVTTQLRPYDLQRVGTREGGKLEIILRDDKPHASPWLLNFLKSAEITWAGAELRFGTILTGAKLVDNFDFREQLQALEPEAIGGEMEGAGLYVACHDQKIDWILVKAICDFADGNKARDKAERQALAASNSAAFVHHAIKSISGNWGNRSQVVATGRVFAGDDLQRGNPLVTDSGAANRAQFLGAVAELMRIADHDVQTNVMVNHQEAHVLALERTGLARKKLVIECVSHNHPVDAVELEAGLTKLRAMIRHLGHSAIPMHVSAAGYTKDAAGLAMAEHIDALSFDELTSRLVNFEDYVDAMEKDPLRQIILLEYQPTKMHFEGDRRRTGEPALTFIRNWLGTNDTWLTVLGDYGVGKSWMLKRVLYDLLEDYKSSPHTAPLPFFVPLQHFTKAFTFANLIVACLQRYGVRSVNFEAVRYLADKGRIVFLFDSFDEMAQILRRNTVRENLKELLDGVSRDSRAIMTSRPTYFESRAERLRLVETNGELHWEQIDRESFDRDVSVSSFISQRLEASRYARLNDLTVGNRKALFRIVLADRPDALKRLDELFNKFQSLETLSQRAVIARLLTMVADTLASRQPGSVSSEVDTGLNNIDVLNEAKIFEIVVVSLLQRDAGIGELEASARRRFLQTLALYLQQPGSVSFASPEQIRNLTQELFADRLKTSDTPQQLLEGYYRACRRHSGLTTERQFLDTSGNIDTPVDDGDGDARVGFSHNSLREYLVAEAAAEQLCGRQVFPLLRSVRFSEAVADFLVGISAYDKRIEPALVDAFLRRDDGVPDWLFRALYGFIRAYPERASAFLGSPPQLGGLDLSGLDLSGLDLRNAIFHGSIAADTDLRKSDLRNANMGDAVLERVMLDEARLAHADFTKADIISIYVVDEYDKRTRAVLSGRDARQWLFSHGGDVFPVADLNPLLGKDWYEAAREVARTLTARIAGTHEDKGLVKGTRLERRQFAIDFRDFLLKVGVLEAVKKDGDRFILKVVTEHRQTLTSFAEHGQIHAVLQPFFDKHVDAPLDKS